jgi:solute carrier family 8 (sodium/calcium exchanger)
MQKNYPEIKHQYDIWHVSKGVVKKLAKNGEQKPCRKLMPRIQSASNHLWWLLTRVLEMG